MRRSPSRSRGLARAYEDTYDEYVSLNTRMLALEYDPGDLRVRFHLINDIIGLLRERYMGMIFVLSCIVLISQIVYSLSTVGFSWAEVTGDMKLADALHALIAQLGWVGPVLLCLVGSLLLRKHSSVYLVDFATFDPPPEWRLSKQEVTLSVDARSCPAACSHPLPVLVLLTRGCLPWSARRCA